MSLHHPVLPMSLPSFTARLQSHPLTSMSLLSSTERLGLSANAGDEKYTMAILNVRSVVELKLPTMLLKCGCSKFSADLRLRNCSGKLKFGFASVLDVHC